MAKVHYIIIGSACNGNVIVNTYLKSCMLLFLDFFGSLIYMYCLHLF